MADDILLSKKDDETVWVENLLPGDSVYRSDRTKEKYPMTPHGFIGSVIAVPVPVAKEGFFRRAISRGKLQLLTDEAASSREADLKDVVEDASEPDRLMKSLEKGASENSSRFVKEGLSDDGTERQSMTAQQVLGGTPATNSGTVRRSVPANEPEFIEPVLTEPMKEGDLPSDTGV